MIYDSLSVAPAGTRFQCQQPQSQKLAKNFIPLLFHAELMIGVAFACAVCANLQISTHKTENCEAVSLLLS